MSATTTCVQCGTSYAPHIAFCPRDGAALGAPAAPDALVGTVVGGRYRVLRALGAGGMGEVYLAEHVKMGRPSAIKVMSRALAGDPDAVGRFHREAANASRITHPHVAGIYDFGEMDDGLLYLAMEFVDGEPLTRRLGAGALPRIEALEIVRQVAAALDAAHELGIVHRDLKPDNIMLARGRQGEPIVKVVDFGIAKAADAAAQRVTRTGLVVGTPAYMSPEHLAGDAVDGRSDIYALGLVACELLTGSLPFPADTAQEMLLLRLTGRPSTLSELRPDIAWPPALQCVLDRALARDAAARYGRAGEMAAALLAAGSATGVAATAGTTATNPAAARRAGRGRRGTAVRRASRVGPARVARRAALGGAAALLLAAAAGLALARNGGSRGAGAGPSVPPAPGATLSRAPSIQPITARIASAGVATAADARAAVLRAGQRIQRGARRPGAVDGALREIARALPALATREDSVRALYYASEGLLRRGRAPRACTLLGWIRQDPGPLQPQIARRYASTCVPRTSP